jgi:hypothetical protein
MKMKITAQIFLKPQLMMMIEKIFLFIITIIPLNLFSQSSGQWLSLGIEGKINKEMRFEVEQGFRFSDGFTQTQATYTDIGASYRFSKEIKVAANYRFTQRGGMFNVLHLDNRFSAEMRYRVKFNDLTFSSRLRYLTRFRDYNTSAEGRIPQRYIRLKFDLDYNLPKKFSASIGSEIFWQLTALYGQGFDNFWLIAGLNYDLSKQDKLSLTFIRQSREFASDDVAFGNVISLGYVHQLDFSFANQ